MVMMTIFAVVLAVAIASPVPQAIVPGAVVPGISPIVLPTVLGKDLLLIKTIEFSMFDNFGTF